MGLVQDFYRPDALHLTRLTISSKHRRADGLTADSILTVCFKIFHFHSRVSAEEVIYDQVSSFVRSFIRSFVCVCVGIYLNILCFRF